MSHSHMTSKQLPELVNCLQFGKEWGSLDWEYTFASWEPLQSSRVVSLFALIFHQHLFFFFFLKCQRSLFLQRDCASLTLLISIYTFSVFCTQINSTETHKNERCFRLTFKKYSYWRSWISLIFLLPLATELKTHVTRNSQILIPSEKSQACTNRKH